MSMQSDQDRIQRALNEAKKRDLEERYGGTFHESGESLPPDVEAEWLASIEQFERQFAGAGRVTVRHYIGNPVLRPLAEIPPPRLKEELDHLLELLSSNNILIHFHRKVSDAEAYRFITEELLDHEIDDIRVDGMTLNFLYEEFHPEE